MQWALLEVLKGRERTWGQAPKSCLTAHSAPPRLRPLKPTWRIQTHQDLSSHLSREEREGREEVESKRPREGALGCRWGSLIGMGGREGLRGHSFPDLWVGLKMRTGLRINDGCAYWRVQDRPPSPHACHWEVQCEKCHVSTPFTIGVEGSSRDLLHTLSCYRQDTGKLRPGGWDMQPVRWGKCQLPQSSYKGELPSLHHAEHKVLRLDTILLGKWLWLLVGPGYEIQSALCTLDGILFLPVYPKKKKTLLTALFCWADWNHPLHKLLKSLTL